MSTRPQAPWPARVRIRPLAIGSVALLLTLGLSSNRAMASPPSGAASRSNPSDARAGEPAGAADEAAGYDRATALRPQVHPGSFEQVIVNGVFVVRDGQRNDERPGRVLRCGS